MPCDFIIINPYAQVDWSSFGQYRAALHNHTTHSDGHTTLPDAVRDFYNHGFDILAIGDHNVVTYRWDTAPTGALRSLPVLMSTEEKEAIYDGTYGRSGIFADAIFPGHLGPQLRRPQPGGMISIPHVNEQSHPDRGREHILTLWADFNNEPRQTPSQVFYEVERLGGLSIINHKGRFTRAWVHPRRILRDGHGRGWVASNDPTIIRRYVEFYRDFPSILGMEIFNSLDRETQWDRILWDNILMRTMPNGRKVFGFSNDDAHNCEEVGFNWNVLLMPALTESDTRIALETGAFYAVTRVDRRLRVNHLRPDGRDMLYKGNERTRFLLEQPTPGIDNIVVDNNTITITGRDYDRIQWIASGAVIYTGSTLDLNLHRSEIAHNYVRAQLINTTGVAMTQPFGIWEACSYLASEPAMP